jgi:hypothetical protein
MNLSQKQCAVTTSRALSAVGVFHRLTIKHVIVIISVLCATVYADEPNNRKTHSLLPSILKHHGIGTDPSSLINALKHKDKGIVCEAAEMLGDVTNNASVVIALAEAAQSEDDSIAFYALRSSSRLQDGTWIKRATNRLATMKSEVVKIDLAVLLANAGQTDGWNFILEMLNDPAFNRLAVIQIEAFDQKRDKEGKAIQVIPVLEKQLAWLSPLMNSGSYNVISNKLVQLKQAKTNLGRQ